MLFIGPMTFIVLLALAACVVVGLAVLARTRSAGRGGIKQVCTQCRNVNPPRAKFCAHCGRSLES